MPALTQSTFSSSQSASRPLDSNLFLINLDSAVERRAHMLAQLQEHNLHARRVGIDCRSLTRQRISIAVARRFPQIEFAFDLLSGAEIGCWMSHLSAWTAFLSESGDACVVVEDALHDVGWIATVDADHDDGRRGPPVVHAVEMDASIDPRPTLRVAYSHPATRASPQVAH
jgi:hypothetical protein